MRSNRCRESILGTVAFAMVALLAVTPGSSAAAGSTARLGTTDHGCRAGRDHDDRERQAAPVAVASSPTRAAGAMVSADIGYVTFGQRLRRLHTPRAGYVLELRLDVIAAAGTHDPDLRLDVDGARLLSCARYDLTPGRVAHLTLTVWVSRSMGGSRLRVTATVRVRAHPQTAVLAFRKTYSVPVRVCNPRGAHGCG